jgi:hypothetical protein
VNALAKGAGISHHAARRRLTKALVVPDALAVIGGSRGAQPLFLESRVPSLVEILTKHPEEML